MKGMLDLLERAGLVRRVGETEDASAGVPVGEYSADAVPAPAPPAPRTPPTPPAAPATAAPAAQDGAGMSLEQVFAAAGVPACAYPAERLLRLLDGLKAMDEPMRRQTIQAIDAADDSWTIEDPMRDAAAKVASIERYASTIRAGVAQAEQETQVRLRELTQRQESSVAEIRRQIADLEGLLAREIARGAQENAALEAALVAQRDSANRELADLSRAAAAFATLITQFGGHAPR